MSVDEMKNMGSENRQSHASLFNRCPHREWTYHSHDRKIRTCKKIVNLHHEVENVPIIARREQLANATSALVLSMGKVNFYFQIGLVKGIFGIYVIYDKEAKWLYVGR